MAVNARTGRQELPRALDAKETATDWLGEPEPESPRKSPTEGANVAKGD